MRDAHLYVLEPPDVIYLFIEFFSITFITFDIQKEAKINVQRPRVSSSNNTYRNLPSHITQH